MLDIENAIKNDRPRFNVNGVEVPRTYYFTVGNKTIEMRINEQGNKSK